LSSWKTTTGQLNYDAGVRDAATSNQVEVDAVLVARGGVSLAVSHTPIERRPSERSYSCTLAQRQLLCIYYLQGIGDTNMGISNGRGFTDKSHTSMEVVKRIVSKKIKNKSPILSKCVC